MNNKTKAIIGIGVVAIIAIALIVIFAGGTNGTKLTLSNYKDYLDIDPSVSPTGKIEGKQAWLGHYSSRYPHVTTAFYSKLHPYINSKNLAPNYSYSDVKVTVRYTVKAYVLPKDWDNNTDILAPLFTVTLEFDRTFSLTAGGTRKDEKIEPADLPSGVILPFWDYGSFSKVEHANYDYEAEIIAISGKVVKPA